MTHYSEKITEAGIKRALNLLKSLATSRCPEDLELLVSRWNSESDTLSLHGTNFAKLWRMS